MAHGLRRIRRKPGRIRHSVHTQIAGGVRDGIRGGNMASVDLTVEHSAKSNSNLDITFTIALSGGTSVSTTANLLAADTDDGRATKIAAAIDLLTGVSAGIPPANVVTITPDAGSITGITWVHAWGTGGYAPFAISAEEGTKVTTKAKKSTKKKAASKKKDNDDG